MSERTGVPEISARGRSLLNPPSPLLEAYVQWMANPYSASNPNGIINCGTAENKLNTDLLLPRIIEAQKSLTREDFLYGPFEGSAAFRNAISQFLEGLLETKVPAEHIMCFTGTGAVVSSILYCLVDPGDYIIVPAPFYGAFVPDAGVLARATIKPAYRRPDTNFALTVEVLEEAYGQAIKEGLRVPALLLCSPDNPTGRIFSEQELRAVFEWAREKRIHLISDEVYAASTYGGKFTSILNVIDDDEYSQNYVHFIWGFSKDFGVSGFRAGVYYGRNPLVKRALGELNVFMSVSRQTQVSLKSLLEPEFSRNYVEENRKRLRNVHDTVTSFFQRSNIPFVDVAEGGLFVVLDLRKYLPEKTWEEEEKLYKELLSNGVYITPGKPFFFPEPGFFRMIISQPAEELEVALNRIAKTLKSR